MAKQRLERSRAMIQATSTHGGAVNSRKIRRIRRSSSASNICSEDVKYVSNSLWDRIPDGPTENILSRLSVVEVLQSRAVCKRWKETIDSPMFAKCYDTNKESSVAAEPCFLVHWMLGRKHNIHAFFPLVGEWKALPTCTIQPQRSGQGTRARNTLASSFTGTRAEDLMKLGFDRGFWCIYPKECGPFTRIGSRRRYRSMAELCESKLTIHNPVTGWSTLLPSYPDPKLKLYPQCKVVSVVVHQTGGSFQVLCAGIHDHDQMRECPREPVAGRAHCLSTLLFDSVSNTWKEVADLPLPFLRFRGDDTKQVTRADYGNLSYFVVQRAMELILLSFDRKSGVWHTIPGHLPQQEKSYTYDAITLSRRRGSLILAFRTAAQNCPYSGHCLFPLVFSWDMAASPEVQHWHNIVLPAPPLLNLPSDYRHLLYTFKWYAKGDFLFFTCAELWGFGALVFNLVVKSWKVAPLVPSDYDLPSPVAKESLPQIIPVEVQLPSVLNLTALSRQTMSCKPGGQLAARRSTLVGCAESSGRVEEVQARK